VIVSDVGVYKTLCQKQKHAESHQVAKMIDRWINVVGFIVICETYTLYLPPQCLHRLLIALQLTVQLKSLVYTCIVWRLLSLQIIQYFWWFCHTVLYSDFGWVIWSIFFKLLVIHVVTGSPDTVDGRRWTWPATTSSVPHCYLQQSTRPPPLLMRLNGCNC